MHIIKNVCRAYEKELVRIEKNKEYMRIRENKMFNQPRI